MTKPAFQEVLKGALRAGKAMTGNNTGRKNNLTCKGKYTIITVNQPLKKRIWRFKDKSSTINYNYDK